MKFASKGMLAGAVAALALMAGEASAEKLNLYCAAEEEYCQLLAAEFEKATGIDVAMTRRSSGETYAQIKAESANPKGDIWWGGTGDPHLQAAEEGLTAAYASPMLSELHPWASKQAADAGNRTVGVYSGVLGVAYNTEILAEKGLPAPKCWADLADPKYKGEIQVANPSSSGTAYTMLATLVQLFGEDKAFDFMKSMHANVNQYTKSGSAPVKAAARGETGIGIVFLHDAMVQKAQGFPVEMVAPCEGTGYEIGSMSIIDGARNMDAAKKFYDWALSADAQDLGLQVQSYRMSSNAAAKKPENAIDPKDVKLIDYDFKKYGSSDERSRLLSKWDAEVGSLPQ